MVIEKTSILTGRKNAMEIDISENRYHLWERSQGKILVQETFPDLSIDEREFLISGITPEEWITHIGAMGDDEIIY
jgi:hypothetical protein